MENSLSIHPSGLMKKDLLIQYNKKGNISIKCKEQNRSLLFFTLGVMVLTIGSFGILEVDWMKLVSRVPRIGDMFIKLLNFDFTRMEFILTSLVETISIALLSTIYSLLLGIVFGMLAAENIFKIKALSIGLKSFFTFLRAVPTPVWVLLMLVSFGFGPEAGIAGLCVHTTAFFTKAFSQSFEDISPEVMEALEVTGANKIAIFVNAILPSAMSQVVAWVGMRFEINFSECAILGMVGAGGIGFVISTSIQGYEYGTAGVAILLVFIFAYAIERVFINLKKKIQ